MRDSGGDLGITRKNALPGHGSTNETFPFSSDNLRPAVFSGWMPLQPLLRVLQRPRRRSGGCLVLQGSMSSTIAGCHSVGPLGWSVLLSEQVLLRLKESDANVVPWHKLLRGTVRQHLLIKIEAIELILLTAAIVATRKVILVLRQRTLALSHFDSNGRSNKTDCGENRRLERLWE